MGKAFRKMLFVLVFSVILIGGFADMFNMDVTITAEAASKKNSKNTKTAKITTIKKLRKKYPRTSKKMEDEVISYLYSMEKADIIAIRTNIYKEIGASKKKKPQYNCWLVSNYVCKNLKYTHGNMASWYGVDEKDNYNGSFYELSFNAIYSLYMGEGVCANYAQTTKWLLDGLGITNFLATCIGHVWNQVKIDGKWYNIDTTWGDPINQWEDDGIIYYMDSSQFLTSDFFHLKNEKRVGVRAKRCKDKRFIGYMYTRTPPKHGSYSYFTANGKTYYSTDDKNDYWITNKWKKL